MIEILSLPRRPKLDVAEVKNVTFKSGLPINSLPGWELIPLNSKLPMLKCPGNQVIFSKNKIGQSFKPLKQEFDPSVRESLPEYNPLHDSNLKTFYANERNLKRLRENGEITQDNDVICNLKDFNEYRQQLHKTRLYYVLREITRLENEQRDRMLITNAEAITSRDHHNIAARKNSYTEILIRKNKLDYARGLRFQRMWQKTQEKFAHNACIAEVQRAYHEQKRVGKQIKMQRHVQAAQDLQRKHLIKLKKLFQFKKDRLQRNLRQLKEARQKEAEQIQIMFWEKRLNERIANQSKMKILLDEVANRRQEFIENHREQYKVKWAKIQEDIRNRAREIQKNSKLSPRIRKRHRKKAKPLKTHNSSNGIAFCDRNEENFDKLLDHELCEALNAAIDMEGDVKMPLDPDDPIYNAAKFIMSHIINKFDKDLSKNSKICKQVTERVRNFFDEAKKFVLFRSSQIISHIRETVKEGAYTSRPMDLDSRRPTLVSFNRLPMTIGTSSYAIHPLMVIKPVNVRTPTPVGSLASINVDSETQLFERAQMVHMCRNELIFVEHYIIKFKRELIVGVGKRVFAAIECHFDNKIMDVRQELLTLDRKFLACQMAKSILSFATNRLNYDASIKLCISALASEIIWSLQKHLLKPERDPRGIVSPNLYRNDEANQAKLCMYCHD